MHAPEPLRKFFLQKLTDFVENGLDNVHTSSDHMNSFLCQVGIFSVRKNGLYWLPKEIAGKPRVEAPVPRRDEGVDEHPRPRNNAGTGVFHAGI